MLATAAVSYNDVSNQLNIFFGFVFARFCVSFLTGTTPPQRSAIIPPQALFMNCTKCHISRQQVAPPEEPDAEHAGGEPISDK